MAYCTLHLVDVERGVPAHHELNVLVECCYPADTGIVESAIGKKFKYIHLCELRPSSPRKSRQDLGLASCWC